MAAFALLGLVSLFAGFVLMLVLPELRILVWGILAVGVALMAIAVVVDFRRLRGALASRRGKLGVGTSAMVSLFVGIVLLVNAISVGHYRRFDVTGLSQFTLTSQTKEVLAGLRKPVEAVLCFSPEISSTVSSYARSLLTEYREHSDRLSVREIDPDLQPDEARRYGIDQLGASYGAVVFRSAEGQRQVYGPQIAGEAEHAFTSAILEVTGTRQKRVYFLTGHGEASIQQGYRNAASGLRDNLFQVGELDLQGSAGVPQDAALLVIAGPRARLSDGELGILQAYLRNGGRALVLLDPNPPQQFRTLLSDWRMDIVDGVIVDPTSYVAPNKDNPLVPRSRNGFGLAEVYFAGATAVIPQEGNPGDVELAAMVWTSREAWLEKSGISGGEPVFDEGMDRRGPLAMGALVSTPAAGDADAPEGRRLAVVGDSDFASDRNFHNGNNGDLFLTAVSWLAAGEEVISVDRKVLATRRLILNPEQERFLHLSSIGLLPLLLLAAGAFVWWRRR